MGDVAVARKQPEADVVPPPAVADDPLTESKDSLSDPLSQEAAPTRGKKGTARGRADYQALLGESLGDKLYSAVAPHLTQESLGKYAGQGVDGAMKALAGALGGLEGDIDPAAAKAFGAELGKALGPAAAEWMKSDSGRKVAESVGDWVDTNPEWIVAVALLAVAGAIVADMEIPEIKQKIGLAEGTDLEVAAKLGSLRNIALQEIKATLKHQSDQLKATLTVKSDAEGVSVDTTARVGTEEQWLEGTATVTEDGLKVWGVKGLERTAVGDLGAGAKSEAGKDPTYHAELTRKDGNTTLADGVEYDSDKGLLTLRSKQMFSAGGDKVAAERKTSSDGSESTSLELEKKLTETVAATASAGESTSADGEKTQTFGAGVTYADQSGLKAAAKIATDSHGGGKLSGSTDLDAGKVRANLNAEYNYGKTTSYKAGGSVTYADGSDKAHLGYSYDSANKQHDAIAMGQLGIDGKHAVRGTVQHTTGDKGTKTSVGAHAARKLDLKDLSVFGGGTVEIDGKGEAKFIPEVGAQVNGVPVKVGFDPSDNSWRVGVTIPF